MARPKLGDSETERLHVKIAAEEIKAIDDWRYANRVPSRSEAVRRLVQMGIEADASLEQIRAQADTVYEDLAKRIDKMLDDVREIKDTDSMLKYHASVLTSFVDVMKPIGDLGSAIREVTEKANVMKSSDDIANLMAKAKQIAEGYAATRERLRKSGKDRSE